MDLTQTALRLAAKQYRKHSCRTTQRCLALIELIKRKGSREDFVWLDYERVGAEFGKSARTILRWKNRWERNGARGLVPQRACGRRAMPIRGHTAKFIAECRQDYQWGAEVISAHLKFDYDVDIKKGRIHRFLKRKGFIEHRRRYRRKNSHIQVVKVTEPGAHTQTDVKHLPNLLRDKTKCYVYNFVDHAAKWEFKKAYDSYGPMETKDFMGRVVREAPFILSRLQSDNGIEYTNKYVSLVDSPREHALDKFCTEQNIRHVLIPPGEKELQGLVERSHRMDDEELYHRIRPKNLLHFNEILSQHTRWKNSSRRRKSLGWKTPNEWLRNYEKNKVQQNQNQEKIMTTEEHNELIQRAA